MKITKTLIIPAGSIKQKLDGHWRTSTLHEGDKYGPTGDELRVIAGFYIFQDIYKNNNDITIIVSGGRSSNSLGKPPSSKVLKDELVALGIPETNIIEENKSSSTFEQLTNVCKILKKSKSRKNYIVTNDYHIKRIETMINHLPELAYIKGKIKLKSAEKILIKKDPHTWEKLIENAYKSNAMKRRIAMEKKGVAQIKKGTYKF